MLNVRIKNKRDTNSNFEQNNPVLLNGEIVIVDHETDGIKIKVGDGINKYSSLPYFGSTYSEKPVYTYSEIQGLDEVISDLETKIQLIPIIPSGVIMMWSGLETDIPDGYVLCNGQNGTPDLTDKFVIGAGNNYSIGDTGGEASHKLTLDEIPTHTHGSQYPVVPSATGGGVEGYVWNFDSYDYGKIGTTEAGGSLPHNNMPPYYALCFIMKI